MDCAIRHFSTRRPGASVRFGLVQQRAWSSDASIFFRQALPCKRASGVKLQEMAQAP